MDFNFNTSSKTPKRHKRYPEGDRFIPSRSGMDLDLAHYNLTCENDDPNISPSKQLYRQALAEHLFDGRTVGKGSKVLAFKNKAPAPSDTYQNQLRSLYSKSKPSGMTASAAPNRKIPQQPEKVLDAPGMRDEFYSHLLDWSSKNVLAVALGQSVYLWNATSSEIHQLMETPENIDISCLSWVGDGTTLAIGTTSAEVQLWDISRSKKLRTLQGHSSDITALSWNKFILSTGSKDTQIINHDVRRAKSQLQTLNGHDHTVCGLRWSDDGTQLASGGNDNVVNIWDQGNDTATHRLTQHNSGVKAMAWCPFQPHLLATGGGTADRTIRFWNTKTGACLNSIDTGSQVCALQWSTDYKEIVSSHGFSKNQLCVWKYPSMEKVTELHGHSARVLHLALSPDGQTVASAAADERIRFWRIWPEKPVTKTMTKPLRASASVATSTRNRPLVIR
jgi:cell division cycle protein 20 (cofactor of APC complex)